MRFAIFASGRGSNAEALMQAFARGELPGASAALLVANVTGAPVLDKAKKYGVPSRLILSKGLSRQAHEDQLLAALTEQRIEHVLLAGYMRILSDHFLSRFRGTVLNIHPSLLPEFPGLHAAERQWQAGVKVAGATVHRVDRGVDTGPVVLMGSLEVRGDEGEAGLAHRILTEVEHVIYPRAVKIFIERLARNEGAPK
jgi:phosphoribosylglycinamide formyltransferase-1